ncbi:MAG: hypothetical protein EBV03_10970 [Proteobacteria bacterium]|nr:hypothetical protein [Pseudomonadota bacterium]
MAGEQPKTLKEQYVPLERRESQNIDWKPFAYETAKFFIVTKLAAVAGYFMGSALSKRKIKVFNFPLDGQRGSFIGGTIGGVYELYDHWHKTEGKRLGINNISKDLTTVIDPTPLERETAKEETLVQDLLKLENAMNKSQPSHAERALARREEAALRQPVPGS